MQDYQAELQRFHRDVEYVEAHWQQLLKQYPEQWVAIFNEQVVGVDSDAHRLLATLSDRGIPTEKAILEYVTAEDDVLILPGLSEATSSSEEAGVGPSSMPSSSFPISAGTWRSDSWWTPAPTAPSSLL